MASDSSQTKKEEKTISESSLYLTIKEVLEHERTNAKMQVMTPKNIFAYCYLGTQDMSMRYQTTSETQVDYNISLGWISQPDDKVKTAIYFSNMVTDGINHIVNPRPGQSRAYLNLTKMSVGLIGDKQQCHVFVMGDRYTTFFMEEKKDDPTAAYIYTKDGSTTYYLTPTEDGRIVAQPGWPQYPFRFPAP